MIDLLFSESAAGGLQIAKSMKPGEPLRGATAYIGVQKKRYTPVSPRVWTGAALRGSAKDVAPLTLALQIGDLTDTDDARGKVLKLLFDDFPGVADGLFQSNLRTMNRLSDARRDLEPVRMWAYGGNPEEMCGLYFLCHWMGDAPVPLSVVFAPPRITRKGRSVQIGGIGDIPAALFGVLEKRETRIGPFRRKTYAAAWRALREENAPLRAVVNGKTVSVPEDFYDFALRANMPDGEFVLGLLIGRTLSKMPGVGDRWLFLRVQNMIRSGEITQISPPKGDHPYSGILRYNPVFKKIPI